MCNRGEALVAVAAVRGSEHLYIEAIRRLVNEAPHFLQHRVMQSGVDLVHEQDSPTRSNERQRDPEEPPDAITQASDRDALTCQLHRDPSPRISAETPTCSPDRRDPLDAGLDHAQRP